MNYINVAISEIKPFAKNNKKHPAKQVEMIANSIKEFGFKNPIIIDKNNEIIAGHGRYLAAQQLGLETVPCIIADDLTEEQVRAYRLLDNKIGDFGEYDMDNILEELGDIGDFQLGLDSLNDIFDIKDKSKEEIEDEIPEVKTPPIVQVGDIFQLGRHRIMCGDSTKKEDVDKLMGGIKADMVFTDPPYGMSLDTDYSKIKGGIGQSHMHEKVIGDNGDFKEELITTIYDNFGYCNEIFVWGADYFIEFIPNNKKGNYIVWDKAYFENGVNGDAMIGSNFELCYSKKRHKRELVRIGYKGLFGMSEDDTSNRVHPTQKPHNLAKRFIDKYSKESDIVVDIYLGSGSTLIACEKTKRICYGMELDPKYIEVIIKRYYDYTNGEDIRCINRDLDLSTITNGK